MPDIFDPQKTGDGFLARLIYHAISMIPREEMDTVIARSKEAGGGKFEVALTVNGVELPAFKIISWLEKAYAGCVAEGAEELIREKLNDRLNQITDLLDEAQRKLSDVINPAGTDRG